MALPDEDPTRLFLILSLCYPALGATLRLAGLLVARGALDADWTQRLATAFTPTSQGVLQRIIRLRKVNRR